jgi:cytochrome P450
MSRTCPTYEDDIYADSAIAAPYGHYAAIREAGPVVWLATQQVYAMGRFKDVKAALLDHRTYVSGGGVALNDFANEISRGTTLASDAPVHGTLRSIIGAPLRPEAVAILKEQIAEAAEALVVRLVAGRRFDGIVDFARFLPVSIISTLVGLPEEGRENMLDWAAATFDCLGPDNDRAAAALPQLQAMLAYTVEGAGAENVRPGSWAAQIYEAADRGLVPHAQVPALLLDYLGPSLDTTIFATGHLLHQLGSHPAQWVKLRNDPALIANAIEEAVRLESPIRGFSRTLARNVEIDGAVIAEGSRVLLLYASANRDETKWDEPDRFDVARPDARDHLGFGIGRHGCAGQHLARLEMQCLMTSLVRHVGEFRVGTPVLQGNNILRGFASLPVEIVR